jgi:hypothetical protein
MLSLLLGSLFVWDFFGRGTYLLAKYGQFKQDTWAVRRVRELKFVFAVPWLMFLQAQPRITALYKYLTGSKDAKWEKTRRTMERQVELPTSTPQPDHHHKVVLRDAA